MKLLSIQIGLPRTVLHQGREVSTGIFKEPVKGPVWARKLGLEGDGQADLRVHGGADKAVYAYSDDAYLRWRELRPQDRFEAGAMGENLTLSRLDEGALCVGDRYRLGTAVLEVSEPRFPCFKLGIKFGDPGVIGDFGKVGRPGIYLRVVEEGQISPEQVFSPLDQEEVRVSIQELFQIGTGKVTSDERLREVLRVRALSPRWRQKLERNLAGV